jgi:hypothetical protein
MAFSVGVEMLNLRVRKKARVTARVRPPVRNEDPSA